MDHICPHCGRPLEEGEICSCQKSEPDVILPFFPEQPSHSQDADDLQDTVSWPRFTYDPEPTYQSPYAMEEDGPAEAEEVPPEASASAAGDQPSPRQRSPRYKDSAPPQDPRLERLKEVLELFLQGAQHLAAQLLPLLLRPVSHGKELALAGHPAVGWELMGIRALLALILSLVGVSGLLAGAMNTAIVFQVILLVLLLTVGMDALTAFLLHLVPSLLKGKLSFPSSVVVVGSRCLFDILFLLPGGLILLLARSSLGLVILLIGGLLSLSVEYTGFLETCSKLHRDRAPYVYALVKAVVLLLSYLILALLARQIMAALFTSLLNSLVLLSAASMT